MVFDWGALKSPILLQPREVGAEIVLADQVALMNGCEIIARTSVYIGARTLIGPQTLIYDADFHAIDPQSRHQPGKTSPVNIGARAIILKGVQIDDDAVVAASCVVTKNVEPGAIVAGNPMRVIGTVDANRASASHE